MHSYTADQSRDVCLSEMIDCDLGFRLYHRQSGKHTTTNMIIELNYGLTILSDKSAAEIRKNLFDGRERSILINIENSALTLSSTLR